MISSQLLPGRLEDPSNSPVGRMLMNEDLPPYYTHSNENSHSLSSDGEKEQFLPRILPYSPKKLSTEINSIFKETKSHRQHPALRSLDCRPTAFIDTPMYTSD